MSNVADADLQFIHQQLWEVEQRQMLMDSMEMTRHMNAQLIVTERVREYCEHFAHGGPSPEVGVTAPFVDAGQRDVGRVQWIGRVPEPVGEHFEVSRRSICKCHERETTGP